MVQPRARGGTSLALSPFPVDGRKGGGSSPEGGVEGPLAASVAVEA